MRERRKQHKLTKSAEQTNSQQKKRFQLIFRHTTSQCSRAQKPNSKKRKQTNKHAIANTETLSQAWKKILICISKHPGMHTDFLSCSALRSCSVRTTTLMCLARSLELPIKKSENAVCRKWNNLCIICHHQLTVIFINVSAKTRVCNYYRCEV